MPVTMEQVLDHLNREEVDYALAAQLGVEAIPHLITLIQGADLGLATKAASLAGAINTPQSRQVLKIAAQHSEATVRVASAVAARRLPTRAASNILLTLLDDPDVGVRKVALKSVPVDAAPKLRAKVQKLTTTDPEDFVRTLSRQVLSQLRTKQ